MKYPLLCIIPRYYVLKFKKKKTIKQINTNVIQNSYYDKY